MAGENPSNVVKPPTGQQGEDELLDQLHSDRARSDELGRVRKPTDAPAPAPSPREQPAAPVDPLEHEKPADRESH
jgi:hypothetical protein